MPLPFWAMRIRKHFQSQEWPGEDLPMMIGVPMTKPQPQRRGICPPMACKEESCNQIVRPGRPWGIPEPGTHLSARLPSPLSSLKEAKADKVYIPELPPKERDWNIPNQNPSGGGFSWLSLRAGANPWANPGHKWVRPGKNGTSQVATRREEGGIRVSRRRGEAGAGRQPHECPQELEKEIHKTTLEHVWPFLAQDSLLGIQQHADFNLWGGGEIKSPIRKW